MKLLVSYARLLPLAILLSALLALPSGTPLGTGAAATALPFGSPDAVEATSSVDFAPGELLVKLKDPGDEALSSFLSEYPFEVKERIEGLGVVRLEVPVGEELETASQLQSLPIVEWAEPDQLRSTQALPNDQLYRQFQWDMRKIQAERAWDITTGSSDVVVAVLDTGVDASHPDLAGKLLPGYDLLNDDEDPSDDSGHGTHNAGVIGAASNNSVGVAGISWGTKILPLKVLNSSGVGPDSVISQGIIYAADHGARIINMSFGSSTTSRVLVSAVRYAANKGVLMVAAAGNTAKVDNAIIYPAAYPEVVAVSATDESDEVPDFSQHHPYVEISAPGVHIVSTFWRGAGYGNYVSSSGTSDAAPHVSGLAALLWSVNPQLSSDQVRTILQQTADDLGAPGRDDYYGAGRINAYEAVAAAKPAAAPTATVPPAQPTQIPAAGPTQVPATGPTPVSTPAALPRTVWYFAEGSTAPPFDLWLLLQNPNMVATTAKVTYMKGDGTQQIQEVWLPPISRKSIFVNQVVPDAEVSMKVEANSLVFAERAMYFGHDGHSSVGAAAPATRWYMAEGSTRDGFDTWVLLQNPLNVQSNARVTFIDSEGQRKELLLTVPPTSRRSIYVNQILPGTDVSTIVSSDSPLVVERAMYFQRTSGHGSVAASQTNRNWYLAEGVVGDGFDTWLLVLNPSQAIANLRVTYMREDGSNSVNYYAVPAGRRLSVYANSVMAPGRFGATVESDQPIVVERSTYFADGQGSHNVVASPLLAQEWYVPEGSTKPPFQEIIAVLNPNDREGVLTVAFMKIDGNTETRTFRMKPTSRLTLNVNELLPNSEASLKLTSDLPVVVERSMYFSDGLGGTSSMAVPR